MSCLLFINSPMKLMQMMKLRELMDKGWIHLVALVLSQRFSLFSGFTKPFQTVALIKYEHNKFKPSGATGAAGAN